MKRIRLIATSDVHGYIYPYSYADNKPAKLGLARLSTLVESLRDENTLLLDNGDMLEGAPLSFYHYHFQPDEVSPMSKVMNEIGYDYVNVGNHDFNYGEEALMMHLQNLKAPCITSNWLYHNKPFGPTYAIREIDGVKIAFFGLVTKYIPNWEKKSHIAHSQFLDCVEVAKKTVETIKRLEKCDFIVCMYHGGFEKDPYTGEVTEALTGENQAYEIISKVRGIDVLITGHQHRSMCGKLLGTTYTQTSDKAQEVACIDLYPDTKTIEATLLSNDMKADASVTSLVQSEEDKCQSWLDTPLGESKIDLSIQDEEDARFNKSQLITFLNKVTMEKTGADLSANALFLGATGFQKDITMRQLVSTYVYPNTLFIKKINGRVLRAYLEKNAEFFTVRNQKPAVNPTYLSPKPQQYNYDMIDGIEYTIACGNPVGNRIVELKYQGKDVTDDMVFTIAMNNYRASGGGNFFMLQKAETVKEIQTSMVEILAEYIMEKKVIDFTPVHNIRVIV